MRKRLLRLTVPLLAFTLLGAAACGGDDDSGTDVTNTPVVTATPTPVPATLPPNPPGNLLTNPGFEDGAEPWITLNPASGFEVSDKAGFTGAHSALLRLNEPPGTTGEKVVYLVQEVNPPQFPEVLRGAYRVENWQKGTAKQYLQVAVVAFAPDNYPPDAPNYQIRYILAGVQNEPLDIGNAIYKFFSQEDPLTNRWLAFEANIKQDFEELWGGVPAGYDRIRVLFEVRYDDKLSVDGSTVADVYYDDLYLGSAQ